MGKKSNKELTKEIKEKSNKTFKEFKEFISKGNVIDLAVGVIIGGAFSKIVSSLVNDIIMPLIGIIIGGIDFTNLTFKIKDATVSYGVFIQNILDFLIVAACIFTFVKLINKLNHKKEEPKEEVKEEPKKSDEVLLLEEIRDLLKKWKVVLKILLVPFWVPLYSVFQPSFFISLVIFQVPFLCFLLMEQYYFIKSLVVQIF